MSADPSPHERAVEAALSAAEDWARATQGRAGRLLRVAVTNLKVTPVERVDVTTRVKERRVVPRLEPVARRTSKRESAFDLKRFDPWAPDVEQQIGGLSHVITCPTCNDAQQVTCTDCGGSVLVQCKQCGGTGRTLSSRSRQMVNCRSCRGDGTRKCRCRDGFVDCATCRAKGCVQERLGLTESTSERHATSPRSPFGSAAARELVRDVERVNHWTGTPEQLSGTDFSRSIAPNLIATVDGLTERITTVTVSELRSYAAHVTFSLCGEEGELEVQGWTGRIVPPRPEADVPFGRLRRRMMVVCGAALVVGALVANWYAGRHPFFAVSRNAMALAALALAAPILFLPAIVAFSLRPAPSRALLRVFAALIALATVSTQAVLAMTGRPSLAAARQHLTAGRTERALLEADALVSAGDHVEEAAALHDQLQVQRIRELTDSAQLWRSAATLRLYTTEGRTEVDTVGLQRAHEAVEMALKQEHPDSARSVLNAIPARLAGHDTTKRLRTSIRHHELTSRWRAIDDYARPLSERVAACGQLETMWGTEEETVPTLPGPFAVRAACDRLRADQAAAQRRAEAAATAARLAGERQQRQREQRERAAARAWALAPLLCRDGSLSPTCLCGRGSYRGCCSHHGGVAGCSQ